MTHGSLYSGIGGWLLAARRAGIKNVFTCEDNKFCNKVIDKRFPEIPKENKHHDIKETDFTKYRGAIDIISTSDPCQPFSFAGKRGGKADDRYLWPQTIRVIREIKPSYVIFENVPGLLSLDNGETFEGILSDLENERYIVEPFIIPACAIGAWHRRERLWFICYGGQINTNTRCFVEGGNKEFQEGQQHRKGRESFGEHTSLYQDVSNTNSQGLEEPTQGKFRSIREKERSFQGSKLGGTIAKGWEYWEAEPNVGRVAHGIPSRVDRLKSLGNSIVPQIAYIIFEAIKQHDLTLSKE